MVACCVRIV